MQKRDAAQRRSTLGLPEENRFSQLEVMSSRSGSARLPVAKLPGGFVRISTTAGVAAMALAAVIVAAPSGNVLDLTNAVVVAPAGLSGPETRAVAMLVDEVARRSQIRWTVGQQASAGRPAVYLGPRSALVQAYPGIRGDLGDASDHAEGYAIRSGASGRIVVAGNDSRGVLFGAGRLLRLLDYHRGKVELRGPVEIVTAPRYPLRGHQLGFRPKTNSYDAWDAAQWEQYIRDLVVFGANAIEGIPPRSDDDADSPHFPLPQMQMMIEQSRLAEEYGIDYWVWYPALDKDYGDPATVDFALKEWGEVLRRLPRLDALFVPGGDPGRTPPKFLMALLEKQAAQLKEFHPKATMWVSPQGFSAEWMDEFYKILKTEPTWLEGVVFGPQQRESLEELRSQVPARYKVRFYPDITHSITCQYPVPDWDFAYAATENREVINPRPVDEAAIYHRLQPLAPHGVLTYSEGCNDDVNKCVWSSLAWDPEANVTDILRDYSRYYIGTDEAEGFAQGLLSLERNWRGSLLGNGGVYTTLEQFQEMERKARPAVRANWRFQQALYRAYYDATDRARLLAETRQVEAAKRELRRAATVGSADAIEAARRQLEPPAVPAAADWRARTFELAEALFQSVRMQLSVPRYQAIAVRRGANLDLIDFPLSDGPWLLARMREISALPKEAERVARIDEMLDWTNPGPGGFYDDLGNTGAQPHLVHRTPYAEDPAFLTTPYVGFSFDPGERISSLTFAQTLNETPLEMHYDDLDPSARYRVRVVYGNEEKAQIRMMADDAFEIQPMQRKPMDLKPVEFHIPAAATADGKLTLQWTRPAGLRGNGRGVQVAEVWLIRDSGVHE